MDASSTHTRASQGSGLDQQGSRLGKQPNVTKTVHKRKLLDTTNNYDNAIAAAAINGLTNPDVTRDNAAML